MSKSKLRQERNRRGESTWKTAAAVGTTQSHYFRVESGETGASPELAADLSAHFGVHITKLFQPLRYKARS